MVVKSLERDPKALLCTRYNASVSYFPHHSLHIPCNRVTQPLLTFSVLLSSYSLLRIWLWPTISIFAGQAVARSPPTRPTKFSTSRSPIPTTRIWLLPTMILHKRKSMLSLYLPKQQCTSVGWTSLSFARFQSDMLQKCDKKACQVGLRGFVNI